MSDFGYVLIASGEYSDYRNRLFKVEKEFSFDVVLEEFKLKQNNLNDLDESNFIGWLNKEGYISDADIAIEVHVGSYGELEINYGDGCDILFKPK